MPRCTTCSSSKIFAGGPAHYPPLPDSVAQLTSISTAQVERLRQARVSRGERRADARRATSMLRASPRLPTAAAADRWTRRTIRRSRGRRHRPRRPARSTASDWRGSVRRSPTKKPRPRSTSSPIISSATDRRRSKALDRSPSDALVAGQFITLHDPGVMVVTIGGDHEKQTEQRVLEALATLQQPMDRADVRRRSRSISLSRRHRHADAARARRQSRLVYASKATCQYAPGIASGSYERAARALDPQYVADVVRRYLRKPVVVDLIAATPQKESPMKLGAAPLAQRRSACDRASAAPRAAGAAVPAPTLENAGGTTIVRQSDSAASLVGVAFVVRAGLDRANDEAERLRRARRADDRAHAGRRRRRCRSRTPSRRAAARCALPSIRATCASTSKRWPATRRPCSIFSAARSRRPTFRRRPCATRVPRSCGRSRRASSSRAASRPRHAQRRRRPRRRMRACRSSARRPRSRNSSPTTRGRSITPTIGAAASLISAAGRLDSLAPDALPSLAAALPGGHDGARYRCAFRR